MILNPWKRITELEEQIANQLDQMAQYDIEIGGLLDALDDIVAEERPTSNATVKRMARIARDARAK
jgi:uncharacterized coiled-coil protein SlyX